jgi:hypothetical protein
MSSLKPLVLGVALWGFIAGGVRADAITWLMSNPDSWQIYLAGQPQTITATYLPNFPYWTPAPAPAQQWATQASPQTNVVSNVSTSTANPPGPSAPAPAVAAPFSAAESVTVAASRPPADAYINLGNGPYPNAGVITTGGAQPWYNSSQIASFFGGQPTLQQQQSFDNAVLQRVEQTFAQSGIPVTLTTNPNVPALHTLSLVSNTGSATLSTAIGMTQIGTSGFSFIDLIAKSAQSLDQLEWIVAHNISHELMLAFGVPENYDQSGKYIDSKVASWSMMVNPNGVFSPGASQAIEQALGSQQNGGSSQLGAQLVDPLPAAAPEPTTWLFWTIAGLTALGAQRLRRRAAALS